MLKRSLNMVYGAFCEMQMRRAERYLDLYGFNQEEVCKINFSK